MDLTDRRKEIWAMLAYGVPVKEISTALRISPKTVEYHRAQLMRFWKTDDVVFLVRLAIAFGLIDYEHNKVPGTDGGDYSALRRALRGRPDSALFLGQSR